MTADPLTSTELTAKTEHASLLRRLQLGLQTRLIPTITISVLFSLALTGTSAWNIWRIYQGLQSTITKEFKLQESSGKVIHLDEVLTMSARMAASTGDLSWEERYNANVPALDEAIGVIMGALTTAEQTDPAKTDAANQKLIEYETKAFDLVREGKAPQALDLLLSSDYKAQKLIYTEGINGTLATVDQQVNNQLQAYQQRLAWSVTYAIASLVLLALTWSIVLSAVRGYIQERRQSQIALEASRSNLLTLNEQLKDEAEQRSRQEEQIYEESELLQADVGHILDIVSALEDGDLTIEAEVNERATGLVSDTLNRLIESLNRVVSSVVVTAQQVTESAGQLEGIAVETAEQAQEQTVSVQEVKSLMEAVNTLTSDSLQQALATGEAVEQAKAAVSAGQQGMDEMAGGIETLQVGTDQMVKRTQLLNEFVDLATQFSKDQKRVASLTKVLSLNASTLATRALKEEDPAQFASLASEFDAIARQVNDLATETNHGLVLLQQRTNQIQTVSSGLNHDVSEISQLVQAFTQEVGQARQAFGNIQQVTEQVEQVGKRVSYSSQQMVEAVQNTLTATQAIAMIAQQTDAKAAITREQVEAMGNIARTLLEMVAFFRVENEVVAEEQTEQPPAEQTIDVAVSADDVTASADLQLVSA
ncbi:MAG: methyl-accepting chemotaxis protein [Thermosynechococcaceae cyanobacterium]